MADNVMVAIPVTPEVAAALQSDAARRDAVGALVSRMVQPAGGADPLMAFLNDLPRATGAAELSEAAISAEITAQRAQLRS